jgi:patatin-like phospholipase
MISRARFTLVPLWAFALVGAPLQAQSAAVCDTTRGREPTLLTVEGGGSLGVYEAGMAYTLVEAFKRKRVDPRVLTLARFPEYCLAVATGASAGNINAFLATTSWCDATPGAAPESSTFWQTWVTTGLTQLLPTSGDASHKNEGGLFTRRHFREYLQDTLRQRWKKATWIQGCRVRFGATVTRLVADTVAGAGSIKARNQRMAFAIHVDGIDAAGEPEMRKFVPDRRKLSYGPLAMLGPFDTTSNKLAWAEAFLLIETSSGYPVAFEPLPIAFCTRLNGTDADAIASRKCAQHDSTIVLDGGVFDNGPIALAYSLYFETHDGYRPPTAIYLSPDRRRVWRGQLPDVTRGRGARPKSRPYGLEGLAQLAREAFPTARQYELAFAGRMLPAEIARQDGQTRLGAFARANADLAEALDRQRTLQRFEADSLRATIARLCLEHRAAQPDSLGTVPPVPPDCATLASFDTTMPRRPVMLQGVSQSAFVRRTADPLRTVPSIDSTFRSTERWHPLAGDWLAGFGAFLARPLREYDFYVGMYDAFVLLAENGQCNSYRLAQANDTTRASSDRFRKCLADSLPLYFANPPIALGPVAPHILRELYAYEFKTRLTWAAPPLRPRDDSSLVVIRAIGRAMYEARMAEGTPGHVRANRLKPAPGHCTRVGVFDRMFCESGVVAFFDRLSTQRQAVAIMERWSDEADCRESRWDHPDACRTEPRFVAMIEDPEGELRRLTSDLLSRLETVTPPTSGSRVVASGLLFLHGSVTERHRRGFDFGPTSVPTNGSRPWRTFLMLLPNSAMLTPNTAGWGELTWELRRHLGQSPYALTLPVHARVQSQIGKSNAYGPDVSMIVPGLRLEHKDIYMASRIGIEVDAWFTNSGWLPSRYVGHTYGLFASLLGRINVSWTTVPSELTYFREKAGMRPFDEPTILTVGFGDVRGLVYWGRRMLF